MTLDKLINYLKLDKQEFLFQFNSHPNYPSALAFSDTLNFLGVKNDAYELDKEYWDELPEEFIAIVDNSFSLVKKAGAHYSVYSDKSKTLNKEELHKSATDFVLLFEKTQNSEQKISNYKPFIYAILGVICLYTIINHSWYEIIFNILSLAGVYISLEIFNQKFGNTSAVIGSICGDTSAHQAINSCNKIINEDKTSILGLKFSDFSLIYFIGIAVLGLFLPATAYIIKGFTIVSLIAIGYSLYIQAFVEKTFCRVCLLIISILTAQLILSLFFFENLYFNSSILLLSILLWGIVFFVVSYLNNTLKEQETLQKSNAKNLRFKRNYELFKRELLDHERITFSDNQTFSLGNKEARIRISVVSNPYCGFCKGAHEILEDLLKKYPNDISAQIRFNYFSEKSNEKSTGLLSDFMNIYKNKHESEFLKTVETWFKNRDETQITQIAGSNGQLEDLSALESMSKENAAAGLNFTPIFIINGFQFPDKYDREDIHYFIDELIEDEEI
ncbi:ABC transporter permease [Chryseobacterium piperi]|uniref:ABC transporter permease n=1 Tax=Chryseobacterium piperi TaxID=558152 RepID=A0A086APX0_9FLAO|nr:thioredoxin domain-containing protein [Chryseobacterium piperi]ASW74798.1 ABC transporter permease [Chryseobacterium piperi]KFF18734.1 ABC transporter permease [Chryseobacterium piperi]